MYPGPLFEALASYMKTILQKRVLFDEETTSIHVHNLTWAYL